MEAAPAIALVDRAVLAALRGGRRHGRAIARQTRLPAGAVHASLRRLERETLVAGRPRLGARRLYRLTGAGEEALRVARLELRAIAVPTTAPALRARKGRGARR